MGKKKLNKVRWQLKVSANVAAAFDGATPANIDRSGFVESIITAYLRKNGVTIPPAESATTPRRHSPKR